MLCLKIWWHKRQARKLFGQRCNLVDQYDCGIDMINVITGGEYNRITNVISKHILWLKENDPKYPHSK